MGMGKNINFKNAVVKLRSSLLENILKNSKKL